jgi:RES domain-containing protein
LANVANTVSHASAYDIGHATATATLNIASVAAPEVAAAGRASNVARIGSAAEGARPIGIQFEGSVFRLENPSRVNTTFDAHAGNVAANHRYSGPGQGAVYGATSPETALAEMQHYGLSVGRVSVSKEIQLGNVLDLTNSATRRELGVTLRDITGNSYTHTQRIGDWARVNGYDGILAPSARNSSGTNLIIFPGGK